MYDLLYGDQGVRLNIVRLTISPNARPLPPAATDVGTASRRYDWASDDHTQSTWKAIQPVLKRTRPVIYAVPFTPPVRWKTNGRADHGGSLRHEHYREYAEYLASFLDYYHQILGVDVDALSVQNEPGVAAPWDSCIWTGAEFAIFLRCSHPPSAPGGSTPGSCSRKARAGPGQGTTSSPPCRTRFARAARHHGQPLLRFVRGQGPAAVCRSLGSQREAGLDERDVADVPAGAGRSRDECGHADSPLPASRSGRKRGSAWIYCFAIFTSKFPGSMGVLSPADGQGPLRGKLVVPKRFWTMANYSHFVRPGWRLMQIDGVGFANTGFVNPKGDGFVIVALNPSSQPQPTAYEFSQGTVGSVEAFATTADLDLARIPLPATHPRGFSAALLPMSVTTFVGRLGR